MVGQTNRFNDVFVVGFNLVFSVFCFLCFSLLYEFFFPFVIGLTFCDHVGINMISDFFSRIRRAFCEVYTE